MKANYKSHYPRFLSMSTLISVAAIILFALLTGFAYMTFAERRVIALMQVRIGPNRVGPFGFLQPLADGIKLVFKEDIVPAQADKPVFALAPMCRTWTPLRSSARPGACSPSVRPASARKRSRPAPVMGAFAACSCCITIRFKIVAPPAP